MQPQDAVKLVYQSTFGAEHLIRDVKKAGDMLRSEMEILSPDPDGALYEPIGNGLCRLNLRPCLAKGISDADILKLFLSAGETKGDKKEFRKNLRILQKMAEQDETPFDAAELDYFLILYEEKGYPAVHHSAQYNNAYKPAYRIVPQHQLKSMLKKLREK